MVWADKIGLIIALSVAVVVALLSSVVLMLARTMAYDRLNDTLAIWAVGIVLLTALPTWLLLRAIDFAIGGPANRRTERRAG